MQRHPRPEPAAIPLPVFAGTDAADTPAPGPATVERAIKFTEDAHKGTTWPQMMRAEEAPCRRAALM